MAGLSPSDSRGLQDRGSAVPVRQSRDETGMHVCVCGGGEVEVFEEGGWRCLRMWSSLGTILYSYKCDVRQYLYLLIKLLQLPF